MRFIIGFEGVQKFPNQLLMNNSLTWPKEPVPICVDNNNLTIPPIGTATDIRREDDGSITAEIDVEKLPENVRTLLKAGDISATIYAHQVLSSREGDLMKVRAAKIRAIFFDPNLPW